jgi:hypothetical protein
MNVHLGTEQVVHGPRWHTMHNGYFANPAVARPLVEAVCAALDRSPAEVIVDLGGGTGFLLAQLAAACPHQQVALRNLDCSAAQLAQPHGAEIVPVHATIADFQRADVTRGDQRLFLLMRSVLHYAGRDGLPALLRHLRAQARPGESFVHQSAAFRAADDATCLNTLYQLMRTNKWYPTVSSLTDELQRAGWQVKRIDPAPTLALHHDELALRYALAPADLAEIRHQMPQGLGHDLPVFHLTADGFRAELHYHIFHCVAV